MEKSCKTKKNQKKFNVMLTWNIWSIFEVAKLVGITLLGIDIVRQIIIKLSLPILIKEKCMKKYSTHFFLSITHK